MRIAYYIIIYTKVKKSKIHNKMKTKFSPNIIYLCRTKTSDHLVKFVCFGSLLLMATYIPLNLPSIW